MSDNRHFDAFVNKGNPVGEVVGVDRFLVRVKGLQPVTIHALILFEDGSKGFTHQIWPDYVVVLHLGATPVTVGTMAVVQHTDLVSKVGKDFVGRVVSVNGDPLDGKGPISAESAWPIFNSAPMLYERELLNKQLVTGVTVIDEMFPIVRGQRMALIGDSKSGKSALATQVALSQKDSDVVVIYVLIAKRRSDIDTLLSRLEDNKAMHKAIVVVSTMFESLVTSYLAPYVACAMGEYLWQKLGQDVVIIYDDLTSHAQIYREISLLSQVSPGRESFPGDMFYAHSSLLERAGKLNRNHATMTSIPVVLANSGDITAYMPTNIMSITDGQWILDMNIFRDTMRPAINTGLSVTRVGGVGQNQRQHKLLAQVVKTLNGYNQAQQYAHFGSELSADAKRDLEKGKHLYEMYNQSPSDTYTITEQCLMLDIVLNLADGLILDVAKLKQNVGESAAKVKEDKDFEKVTAELIKKCSSPDKGAAAAAKSAPVKEEAAKK
ncbi:MAG: atpA [Candidatus Saccharibacteria bacterium]|nr:atpA [Candidatus Saccharibacteria bacterium]